MPRSILVLCLAALCAAGLWRGWRAVQPSADEGTAESGAPGATGLGEVGARVPLGAEDVVPARAAESPPLAAGPIQGTEATERDPRTARFTDLNRMAIRALEAGDPERACALFEQC
ncbi:MAG TPA: hypothetical protein VMT18_11940, partial [Planctomycetota bacterium]|nr:hypothetical protein [Planctomycetota bacterium]